MSMYFQFSTDVTILFQGWQVENVWQLVMSCLAVFLMAFSYEGLKVLRHCLLRKAFEIEAKAAAKMEDSPSEKQAILKKEGSQGNITMCSVHHSIQTTLHVAQMALAYSLMLIFMTYNAWLAISILIGFALGFYVFGWRNYTLPSTMA
ncbi:high affinity copper uptake protein 1-like isoform X2 [Ptychodera flava]